MLVAESDAAEMAQVYAALLVAVDAGEVEATTAERAYIAGLAEAARTLAVGRPEPNRT